MRTTRIQFIAITFYAIDYLQIASCWRNTFSTPSRNHFQVSVVNSPSASMQWPIPFSPNRKNMSFCQKDVRQERASAECLYFYTSEIAFVTTPKHSRYFPNVSSNSHSSAYDIEKEPPLNSMLLFRLQCVPRGTRNSHPPTILSFSATPSNGEFERLKHMNMAISKKKSKMGSESSPKTESSPNQKHPTSSSSQYATMSTAVCIVPPDDAWDTIQQARHLARDTSFYKWPPAIRLFHPFAPKKDIPSLVGKLAEWIEEEGENEEAAKKNVDCHVPKMFEPFEVTLDSILILPHWEVLDARIEALEERMPQQTLGETFEEREHRKRRERGLRLIEEEEKKGFKRKQQWEQNRNDRRKKNDKYKKRKRESTLELISEHGEMQRSKDDSCIESDATTDLDSKDHSKRGKKNYVRSDEDGSDNGKSNSFNGPCVIYLSPDEKSRVSLESLRHKLQKELFPTYNAFSPSSSVSPYPERLPRKVTLESLSFRPLLPVARFSTVDGAVKIAKLLQKVWEPLTFNVTDIQFVSRNEDESISRRPEVVSPKTSKSGVGFEKPKISMDWDVQDIRHRMKRGTPPSSTQDSVQRMALTSSGEVEDLSNHGVYGCDAMVMLLGEEPEEDIMDDNASLAMLMTNSDEGYIENGNDNINSEACRINYNEVFATAERQFQRMQAHEDNAQSSSENRGDLAGKVNIEMSDDIEKWLDIDDGFSNDEGATVVVGRAQFFMGAMRDYIGMPASSAIDAKDRIMGSGISAVARRRGSIHRLSESWDAGDYGQKDQDYRP